MDPANESHLPTDLLGVLGARESLEGETAFGAAAFLLGEIVPDFYEGQVFSARAPVPLGSRLLASFPRFAALRVRRVAGAPTCRGL